MSRYALLLPEGEVRLAYINLMMREAAGFGGLQQYAVEQFLSGALKKDIGKIQEMMRVKETRPVRDKNYSLTMMDHRDEAARMKAGNPLNTALKELGWDPKSKDPVGELTRERLWDYITRIANKTLGGSFGDMVPGAKGMSGEDVAQVMGFGGNPWPGMIWDGRSNEWKDRTRNVYEKPNKAIFYVAGERFRKGKIKSTRSLLGYLGDAVHSATTRFIEQVDSGLRAQAMFDAEGQLVVDSAGYGVDYNEMAMNHRNLRRINRALSRDLASAPGQLAVWKLVLSAMEAGVDIIKMKGGKGKDREVTVKAGELRKYALGMLEKQVGDLDMTDPKTDKPFKDAIPSQQALQRNFDKIVPKIKDALAETMGKRTDAEKADERIQGIRTDVLEDIRENQRRRRAGKTITASERSAMIRLAAALPVGSPERRAILAGCEKLPEGPMRDNCEKKKEEGASDKKAGKGKLPDALKKHQFTSEDNPNPKGNDKDGDGKSGEKKPFESKKKSARVKSKRESMGMMNDLRKKHGDGTTAYYQAVIDEVKAGVIAPSAVVGGGYKNGKKVAIEWLEGQMKGKKAALIRLAAALPVGSDERKTILRMANKHSDAAFWADSIAKELARMLPGGKKHRVLGRVEYDNGFISLISGVGMERGGTEFFYAKPAYYSKGALQPGHGFVMHPRYMNKAIVEDREGASPRDLAKRIMSELKRQPFG